MPYNQLASPAHIPPGQWGAELSNEKIDPGVSAGRSLRISEPPSFAPPCPMVDTSLGCALSTMLNKMIKGKIVCFTSAVLADEII